MNSFVVTFIGILSLLCVSLCCGAEEISSQHKASISHSVVCEINNDGQVSTTVCDVGKMDFKEKVSVLWELNNQTDTIVKLKQVQLDCSCTEVLPKAGIIEASSSLSGKLAYKQPTLGKTKRIVVFDTSEEKAILEIHSVKARDQYVIPSDIVARENFSIEWAGVYLKGEQGSFVIESIDYDQGLLTHTGTESLPEEERFIEELDEKLHYITQSSRIQFSLSEASAFGKFESLVRIRVKDTLKRLDPYIWEVPVYVENFSGIEVQPTSISLGYTIGNLVKFPIISEVTLKGVHEILKDEIRFEPALECLSVDVDGAPVDGAKIKVNLLESPKDEVLESVLIVPLKMPNGKKRNLHIPIEGIFAE